MDYANSKTTGPVIGDTASSQVLADEIGSEDPTDAEIEESNKAPQNPGDTDNPMDLTCRRNRKVPVPQRQGSALGRSGGNQTLDQLRHENRSGEKGHPRCLIRQSAIDAKHFAGKAEANTHPPRTAP